MLVDGAVYDLAQLLLAAGEGDLVVADVLGITAVHEAQILRNVLVEDDPAGGAGHHAGNAFAVDLQRPAYQNGAVGTDGPVIVGHEGFVLAGVHVNRLEGSGLLALLQSGVGRQELVRVHNALCGQVRVGGKDVRDYDIESLRDQVSVVLQKNVLFSGTIKENLRWGNPNASDEELVAACKLAQADEFVRSFPDGYDTYIEQGGTNVSGGQKQRLCIARALLKKPKILILDDSTSAVDTKTDALIRKAFREEIPDTTKIIIAQPISSIEDADRVIVLDDGRIDAFDTPQQLLKTNKIYQEVYQSQVKGAKEE